MNIMKWFLLLFGVMFLSLQAVALDCQLDFGWPFLATGSNRAVTLYPQSPFPGNPITPNFTNAQGLSVVFSNLPTTSQGTLYNGTIAAPPAKITFQLWFPAGDSGLVNASNRTSTGTASTFPAGAVAWSALTSDQRYQLSGTTLSNSFYPLYSNPSNYASTNLLGGAAYEDTNVFDLAGTGLSAAQAATNGFLIISTNIAYSQATNQGTASTNYSTGLYGLSINYSATNTANFIAIERAALIATNANLVIMMNGSNAIVLSSATAQAYAAFAAAATNGTFAFNLGASTNLPLSSVTGIGNLAQWGGVTTNAYLTYITNWTGQNLYYATNNLQSQITAIIASLGGSTNVTYAFVIQTGTSLTNLVVTTSNLLASAQSNGTNVVAGWVTAQIAALAAQQSAGTNTIANWTYYNFVGTNAFALTNFYLLQTSTNFYTSATNWAQIFAIAQGAAGTNNLLVLSNFFATNFVTGPVQASNLQGAFLANLTFTNGTKGQPFVSDGAGGWLWSNTVPISVTASNIPGGSPGWITMSNLAVQVGGSAVAGPTNVVLQNGNLMGGPLYFGPISGPGNTPLRIIAGVSNLPVLQADYEGGNSYIILGQTNNQISGFYSGPQNPPWSQAIVGGKSNLISQAIVVDASIFGGTFNWIKGIVAAHFQSTIVGGNNNYITGVHLTNNTIIGGEYNGINGSAFGGTIIENATVIGGISNLCAEPYTLASGWKARATNYGAVVFSDPQPGLDDFHSTDTNQFLIRAIGGVGINTNAPSGYSLNVSGAINASGGLFINDAQVGAGGGATNLSPWSYDINANGFKLTNAAVVDAALIKQGGTNLQTIIDNAALQASVTNAISLLNGFGTNTFLLSPTIALQTTNLIYGTNTLLTITGSSNDLINGTYVPDLARASYMFTNWCTNLFKNQDVSNIANISSIWTNNANTNWQVIKITPPDGIYTNLVVSLGPQPFYVMGSLTNGAADYSGVPHPFYSYTPIGVWWWRPAYPDLIVGVGVANPTNTAVQSIYGNNQFNPIYITNSLDYTSKIYVVHHGLGHVPYSVKWYLVCINNDADSQFSAGDWIDLNSIRNFGTVMSTWSDANDAGVSCSSGIGGTSASPFQICAKNSAANLNTTSMLNFMLVAKILP